MIAYHSTCLPTADLTTKRRRRGTFGPRCDSRLVRHGFTIPEASVILVIVVNLLAVVLPFLLQVGETSRQGRCVDNLRQLSGALLSFDEKEKRLPAGQVARLTKVNQVGHYADPAEAMTPSTKGSHSGASWLTGLLPHLGEVAGGRTWDQTKSVVDNREVALLDLAVLYCPARRGDMQATGEFAGCLRVASDWTSGGNDYAGCTGSGVAFFDDARQTYALTSEEMGKTIRAGRSPYSLFSEHRGAFLPNSRLSMSDISSADGTAYVMLIAERRLFRGTGSGLLQSSDGWSWGGPATLFSARFSPHSGLHYDEADSDHPNLLNVGLADGRVKSISFNVDLHTWQNLSDYASGQTIDHPKFSKW